MEGTQEGTQTFPPPYLAGYSEFERTRRLDGSARTQDPGSKPGLRARPRRRPGHDGDARATCCPIWRVGDIIWQS